MSIDPGAQAVMVAYCDWDPTEVVTDRTVLLNGNGTSLLTLPSLYVTDVSAVVITDRLGTVTAATVGPAPADVEWSEDGCVELTSCLLGGAFPQGRRNVAVTYSGGYDPIPATLQATLDSIAKGIAVGSSRAQQKKLLSGSVTYAANAIAGNLLVTEQMVLDQYRIPRVR